MSFIFNVLLLRTSGEYIETNFHFTDKWPFLYDFFLYCSFFGTVGTNGLTETTTSSD